MIESKGVCAPKIESKGVCTPLIESKNVCTPRIESKDVCTPRIESKDVQIRAIRFEGERSSSATSLTATSGAGNQFGGAVSRRSIG